VRTDTLLALVILGALAYLVTKGQGSAVPSLDDGPVLGGFLGAGETQKQRSERLARNRDITARWFGSDDDLFGGGSTVETTGGASDDEVADFSVIA